MAIKSESGPVVNCANCKIPLASYCSRTKLSNEIYTLPNSVKETVLHELFSHIFKLRQGVINSLGLLGKNLELCRYCKNNLLNLLKYYSKILKVSYETESLFSRLIVQSKGRPGRPPKKSLVDNGLCSLHVPFIEPPKIIKSDIDVEFDLDIDSHLLEDDPLGLHQYLGLTRKKKVVDVDVEGNNDGNENDIGQKILASIRDRANSNNCDVTNSSLDMDHLLLSNCSASGTVIIDEILKDPIFSSPTKIHPTEFVEVEDMEERHAEVEEEGPVPCQYCEKTFRHQQRLDSHIKTHHESLLGGMETAKDIADMLRGESPSRKRKCRNSKAKILIKKKRGRPSKCSSKPSPSPPKISLNFKGNSSVDSVSPLSEKIKTKIVTAARERVKDKKCEKLKAQNHNKEECICKICKKTFKKVQFLNKHMRVHSNDKRCTECDKKFKSAALLKRHMQVHGDNNSVFKCDQCQREFPNLLGLQVHAVVHKRKLYTCSGCKRHFKILKNFVHHQETARCTEKKHACSKCGKLFRNKDKVKRHLISMHSETKPFGCELCGQGFRSQADLKFHEVNAHICGETKQYQCEQCGKRFKSIDTLKAHEKYEKLEKKYACSKCGKAFALSSNLKIHEISHSTYRPYMCTYCGRTYKHANDLKSHEVVHYKNEEKPFVCPICGNRYHRKDVLRLHQGREKHFGPDVPIPPVPKKPSSSTSTTTRTNRFGTVENSISPSKIFKIENFDSVDQDDHQGTLYESDDDCKESNTHLQSTGPAPSAEGPSGNSVIQNLNQLGSGSSHNFIPNQLNSVMQLQEAAGNSVTVSQHQHLIPIMHHSNLNILNTSQQPLSSLAQPPFGVPITPVNEAISDFYRIMYDLT